MPKTKLQSAYAKSGVNYAQLDHLKISAQNAAKSTGENLMPTSYREVGSSRGESAYVIENHDHYLAIVQEGLGTKNLVADAVRSYTGRSFYDVLAIDTVAMIVNDLITVGARPLVVQQYLAVGNGKWLEDKERMYDLVNGWKQACDEVGASWGGGETPALSGVIKEEVVDLAGNAIGIIEPKERLLNGDRIQDGDVIIGFESSGIHANGISLARKLAEKLPKGYQTKLENGTTFGEALLVPTHLYSRLLQALFAAEIELHYCVNITGHGWRKLMRPTQAFRYQIHTIPPVPIILQFLQKQLKLSDQEAYATFNMGIGFCVYIPKQFSKQVIKIAKEHNFAAWELGTISAAKAIEIDSLHVTYNQSDLQIR